MKPLDVTCTRSTLILLIASSFGIYGDLFGVIQHIELPEDVKEQIDIVKDSKVFFGKDNQNPVNNTFNLSALNDYVSHFSNNDKRSFKSHF